MSNHLSNIPQYHVDQLLSASKYSFTNKPDGLSIQEWRDLCEREVRQQIADDEERKRALADEAYKKNVRYGEFRRRKE